MDVHLKNKYIDSKAHTLELPLYPYFQYIPGIDLFIKHNMHLFHMAQWSLLKFTSQ